MQVALSTVWVLKQMDGRSLPIWQWMEVKGEAAISKIELINQIHICVWIECEKLIIFWLNAW